MIERKQNHWALILAALCWVVGWAAAVAYGHGFEFQRMVVAIPGVVLAGLFVLLGILKGRGLWLPGLIVVGVTAVYFGVRMLTSPVWDLAKTDILLLSLGLLSLLVGGKIASSERAIGVFLGGLVVLFAVNVGVGVVQATSDPGYAFMRAPRVDRHGVSGLYWHRNYLAGMLELMVPVFIGAALLSGRIWLRVCFGILSVAGLVLAFYTSSRGGVAAVGVGCAVSVGVWVLMVWRKWSKAGPFGMVVAGIFAAVVLLIGTAVLLSKVSEKRGRGGSVDGALTDSGIRLALAGAAYDQWQESALIGTGSRTFSYLVVRNWDWRPIHQSLGNPEMAHNDYLQILAEYGVVGFALLLGALITILGRGVSLLRSQESSEQPLGEAVRLGAVGALSGALVHSCVDYSLHILPNALLFGILAGFALFRGSSLGSSLSGKVQSKADGGGALFLGRFLAVALIVMSAVGALIVGRGELAVFPKWVAFEQEVITSGVNPERKEELREIIEKTPHFKLARSFGRFSLREMEEKKGEDVERGALIEDGLWAMKIAVERHPMDGESRLVYANFLELGGEEEEAARQYVAGIKATWRREQIYGALLAFSDHLARRAEGYFQSRNPQRALSFYERSLEYLERSRDVDYRKSGLRAYEAKKMFMQGRLDFLRGAGIEGEVVDIPSPPAK